ncbi:PIN domain-containing protein [Tardiphaga sp. 604_B6_N1_1]|uniref:PIN domain-containing protein n=1 Tax=Tardiphaga sp. 604_B6_N1_1 TaxID=3240779 RepID=UPI003F249002
MEYDAVTVDTNIFDQKKLNLHSGMLARLKQFKEGSAKLVLSEIVVREVHRHLTREAETAMQALKSAIRQSGLTGVFTEPSLKALREINDQALKPKESATSALKNWMEATGCEVLPAEGANMKRLIGMYFAPEAPFEQAENKKNEFPDAIALITLEDWAKKNQKKILAITQDKGWIAFASESEWIDTETDLSNALQRFQKHADSAREIVANFLAAIETGDKESERAEIESRVADAVSEISPYAEASAAYNYDNDLVELSFKAMHFVQFGDDQFDFKIVQFGKDEIVARLSVEITAEAQAWFSYFLYDEGDQVRIGESREKVELTFDAGILITLQGEFPDDYEITDFELVDVPDSVYFGDINPDYNDDGYEEG